MNYRVTRFNNPSMIKLVKFYDLFSRENYQLR